MEVEARKVVGSAEQKGLPTGLGVLEDFHVVRVVTGSVAVDGCWVEGVGVVELAPTVSTFSLCSVLPTDGVGATGVEAGEEGTEGEGGKGGSRAVTGD